MLYFMVSPDYLPKHYGSWYLLGNYLQETTGLDIRMHMPGQMEDNIVQTANGSMALVYANPFDTSRLIRHQGYLPLVKPQEKYDEMVIFCRTDKTYESLRDLSPGCRIAAAQNKDVQAIGMRLMEGFGLTQSNTQTVRQDSQAAVLNAVYHQHADVGFLLADVFQNLSRFGQKQFKSIMNSHIHDIYHAILLHPDHADKAQILIEAFEEMKQSRAGQTVLDELDLPNGFISMQTEEAEFMIDLMETLRD